MKQLILLARDSSAYGGELLRTRKGRSKGRPLATKQTMHLVLRSSKARGEWSFRRAKNRRRIEEILNKFSRKYGVRIHSSANVGNHIHLHLQLSRRTGYRPFIRAVTAAIAMAVTGVNRWTRQRLGRTRFWDLRPYTRVVMGWKDRCQLSDYLKINQLEGVGYWRTDAEFLVRRGLRLQV